MKEELHIAVLAEGSVENPLVEVMNVPLNGTLHSMYKAVSSFEDAVMRWCKTELPDCNNHLEEILKNGSYVGEEYRIIASVVKVGEYPNEMAEALMQQEQEETEDVLPFPFIVKSALFCAASDRRQKWKIVTLDLIERLERAGFAVTGVSNEVSNGESLQSYVGCEEMVEHLLTTDEGAVFAEMGGEKCSLYLIYDNYYHELVADYTYKNSEKGKLLEEVVTNFYNDWSAIG